MIPRVVLGPARCNGCGREVFYEKLGAVHLGWLHPDGEYECRGTRSGIPRGLTKREYNRLWMRRSRASAA